MQFSGDLELDDYYVFHEHVDSVANRDTDALIQDWQRNLQPNRQPSGTQFMREASKVGALEQAGAECGVDLHTCIHDLGPDGVDVFHALKMARPLRSQIAEAGKPKGPEPP